MMMPSKWSYESALKTVEQYEKRQKELTNLNKKLGRELNKFSQVKFKVNKVKRTITFVGVLKQSNKLILGESVCKEGDVFEEVIGKLIAVKNALHDDINDVTKFIETNSTFKIMNGNNIIVKGTLLTTPFSCTL